VIEHPKFPIDIACCLRESCESFDVRLLEESLKLKTYSGCTLNFVVVSSRYLYCCNVGDSRAVLSRGGVAVALSKDHNISNASEVVRVKQAGGFITHRGINDYMSVTRALGDLDLKGHKEKWFPELHLKADLVIATPDITVVDLHPTDEFLIVASDGLWCQMSDTEAVKWTRKTLRQYADPKMAAKALIKKALSLGSKDNITVIVVVLHRQELMRDVTVHGGNIFGGTFSKKVAAEWDSSDDSGHGRGLFQSVKWKRQGSLLRKNKSFVSNENSLPSKDEDERKEPNAWSRMVETYKTKFGKSKE